MLNILEKFAARSGVASAFSAGGDMSPRAGSVAPSSVALPAFAAPGYADGGRQQLPGVIPASDAGCTARLSISLVMPNYNHGHFLGRSLGALFDQAVQPDEIIIVDDASTDDSVEIIERMIASRANVRFVRNDRRIGAVAALNKGLRLAGGDIVGFPSADDLVFPGYLQTLEQLLRAHPKAAFACACAEIRDEGDAVCGSRPIMWPTLRPRYVAPAEASRQLGRGDNYFLGSVTLYRRRALEQGGGFDEGLASLADGMLQRRLAVLHGYCFQPQTLGVWRHHTSNFSITSVTDPQRLERLLDGAADWIGRDPGNAFPRGYADLFARRLRFNAARVVLISSMSGDVKATRIAHIAGGGARELRMIEGLCARGAVGNLVLLAWLALRLRPFSLARLGAEPFRRAASRGMVALFRQA